MRGCRIFCYAPGDAQRARPYRIMHRVLNPTAAEPSPSPLPSPATERARALYAILREHLSTASKNGKGRSTKNDRVINIECLRRASCTLTAHAEGRRCRG